MERRHQLGLVHRKAVGLGQIFTYDLGLS
jgi:hypothetical protein